MKFTFVEQDNGIVQILHNGKQWGEWFNSRDDAMDFCDALTDFLSNGPSSFPSTGPEARGLQRG